MLEKTFSPRPIEDKFYAAWEKSKAFHASQKKKASPFVIMMPPPNVTGNLHLGHALTYTIQDILIRYHRMRGADVLWQPGMDHAGIATQSLVERQLDKEGLKKENLGRETFLTHVWKWKEKSEGHILSQQKRLGLSPDWTRQRFTLDEDLNKAVRHVFVELYQAGLIYRAKRLVNWDPVLLTAVSDLEVKPVETKGKLYFIHYPIQDSSHFITVATTRPETLFGDTAVAIHADDERYSHLIGKYVFVPLQNRVIPIIADAYCDPVKGSGAVKITPAHDFNDFEVGQRHHLEMISIFDVKGCLNQNVPKAYQDLDRFIAREKVIQELNECQLLEKTEDIVHVIPHGDRSNAILEPYMTDQWYVEAHTLAQPALEAIKKGDTKLVPESLTATYYHWLHHIQPWCISRQLWWGHRIPAWYGPDQKIFVALNEEEANDEATKYYGKKVILIQDEDVLDTWFSSALWPFSTLGWPEENEDLKRYYPSSVLVTGQDILFFWVARMMMMGLYFMKEVPFKTVYLHALVRDEQGQKMSKSKGNVINPLELMDTYGTDAVRFSMAALIAPARDIKFSTSIVEGYRNFATKLWNAARFCLNNQSSFDPDFDPFACHLTVNRWMVSEMIKLTRFLEKELSSYLFNMAAHGLYQIIWGKFCDWYLELIKPIFIEDHEAEKAETRACAGWCLGILTHLLHPFMPFITEEIWENLTNHSQGLLIEASWPFQDMKYEALISDPARVDMEWVIELITALRRLKTDLSLEPSLKLTLGLFQGTDIIRHRMKRYRSFLERLGRIEQFEYSSAFPSDAAQIVVEDATFYVPLGDLIDVEKEKERLQNKRKEIILEKEKLKAKLDDEKFITKAPVAIREKNRQRLEETEQTLARYTNALKVFSIERK